MLTITPSLMRTLNNFLSRFSYEEFYNAPVPLKELLENSAYYPGCGYDTFPIMVVNTKWQHLRINSFVYCDFGVTISEIDYKDRLNIYGYKCIGSRVISPKEYVPKGWKLNLFGAPAEKYSDRRFLDSSRVRRSAVWQIYQRYDDYKDGPELISVLFVIGEGFATYHQLYYHNNIAPKLLFFVQYYDMFGPHPNWEGRDALFSRMIRSNLQCAPEWVSGGWHNHISAVRVWNCEDIGVRIVREYEHERVLANCQARTEIDKAKYNNKYECGGWISQCDDKKIICLRVCAMDVLYEVTDNSRPIEAILNDLKLPMEDRDNFEDMY